MPDGFDAAVPRLARSIRARRLALDLTQEDVAFEAGLSPRHYQQLESEDTITNNPRFKTLLNVARVLKTTIPDLIASERRMPRAKARASKRLPP